MAKLRVNKIAAVGVSTETTGSVFFDGTDDFMSLDGSSDFAFGTGDFAIEFWVYFNAGSFSSDSVDPNLIDFRPDSTNGAYPSIQYDTSANNLRYYVNTANRIDGGQLSDQTWYHIALEREGTSTKMYVNGSQVGSTYSDSTDYLVGANRPVIACQGHDTSNNNRRLDGYISNLRICKGHAVYKSNFTPPTKELDVHPQSVLLVCYDGENIFADKTGRHSIAAYGDRVSGIGTAAQSPIGITTENPGLIRDVDPTTGPTFQGGVGYNSQNWLTLPKGTTADRNRTGGRGILGGGRTPTKRNIIEFVNISSAGNAQDFGDLTSARSSLASCSSSTRGLFSGGENSSNAVISTIDFITISSTSNSSDFGDLSASRKFPSACSSTTRGVFSGGSPTLVNTIDYVEIPTLGNALDFGDLTEVAVYGAGCSSQTRGIFALGQGSPADVNVINYVTIASTGDAQDFGDLTQARSQLASCSSSTRGIFGGGFVSPTGVNTIDYITITTLGNAQDFGDLPSTNRAFYACSSLNRGVFAGGYSPTNVIQFVTISSTGNANDFGDLTLARFNLSACSDSHGGIS